MVGYIAKRMLAMSLTIGIIMLGMRGYELHMQTSAWDILLQQWGTQNKVGMDKDMVQKMQAQLTNTPWGKQGWLEWLRQLKGYLKGDFGKSLWYDRTVLSLIGERLPISIGMGIMASTMGFIVGIPYGVLQTRSGKWQAWGHKIFLSIITALPPVALLLMLMTITEAYGLAAYVWQGVMPIMILILMNIGFISVYTKNSLEHEKEKPYAQALKAKGISIKTIVWRHQLPNALLPIIARIPSTWVMMILGNIGIIEMVSGMEGIGHLWITAIKEHDTPIIYAIVFLGSAVIFMAKIMDDLLLCYLDPRVLLWE